MYHIRPLALPDDYPHLAPYAATTRGTSGAPGQPLPGSVTPACRN